MASTGLRCEDLPGVIARLGQLVCTRPPGNLASRRSRDCSGVGADPKHKATASTMRPPPTNERVPSCRRKRDLHCREHPSRQPTPPSLPRTARMPRPCRSQQHPGTGRLPRSDTSVAANRSPVGPAMTGSPQSKSSKISRSCWSSPLVCEVHRSDRGLRNIGTRTGDIWLFSPPGAAVIGSGHLRVSPASSSARSSRVSTNDEVRMFLATSNSSKSIGLTTE